MWGMPEMNPLFQILSFGLRYSKDGCPWGGLNLQYNSLLLDLYGPWCIGSRGGSLNGEWRVRMASENGE